MISRVLTFVCLVLMLSGVKSMSAPINSGSAVVKYSPDYYIVGTIEGDIVCFSKAGDALWTLSTGPPLLAYRDSSASAPPLDIVPVLSEGNLLLLPDEEGKLHRLPVQMEDLLKTNKGIKKDGFLYFGSKSHRLFEIEMQTGRLIHDSEKFANSSVHNCGEDVLRIVRYNHIIDGRNTSERRSWNYTMGGYTLSSPYYQEVNVSDCAGVTFVEGKDGSTTIFTPEWSYTLRSTPVSAYLVRHSAKAIIRLQLASQTEIQPDTELLVTEYNGLKFARLVDEVSFANTIKTLAPAPHIPLLPSAHPYDDEDGFSMLIHPVHPRNNRSFTTFEEVEEDLKTIEQNATKSVGLVSAVLAVIVTIVKLITSYMNQRAILTDLRRQNQILLSKLNDKATSDSKLIQDTLAPQSPDREECAANNNKLNHERSPLLVSAPAPSDDSDGEQNVPDGGNGTWINSFFVSPDSISSCVSDKGPKRSLVDRGFEIVEKIGEGGQGKVFKVRHNLDGNLYALKRIRLKESELDRAREEVVLLSLPTNMGSKHIVRYHHSWTDTIDSDDLAFIPQYGLAVAPSPWASATASEVSSVSGKTHELFILMEYCDSSLDKEYQRYIEEGTTPDRKKNFLMLRQLVRGIDQLHSSKILHRDLKPGNVFIRFESDRQVFKIGDFGLSRISECCVREPALKDNADIENTEELTNGIGSALYSAPEQLNGTSAYSYKADIFSLGIVWYEAFIRPKTKYERHRLLLDLRRGCIPADVKEKFPEEMELVELMTKECPEERPGWPEITAAMKKIESVLRKPPALSITSDIEDMKKVTSETPTITTPAASPVTNRTECGEDTFERSFMHTTSPRNVRPSASDMSMHSRCSSSYELGD